jgi:hypothetical protein
VLQKIKGLKEFVETCLQQVPCLKHVIDVSLSRIDEFFHSACHRARALSHSFSELSRFHLHSTIMKSNLLIVMLLADRTNWNCQDGGRDSGNGPHLDDPGQWRRATCNLQQHTERFLLA